MAFATVIEVAQRMGITLDETREAMANLALDLATGLIASSASKTDTWAAELDPVPVALKAVCLEVAVRAMGNPGQLQALTENLGSYSYTQNFRTGNDNGILLTDAEQSAVESAVAQLDGVAVGAASAAVESVVSDLPFIGWPHSWPVELSDLGEDDPAAYMGD